MSLSSTILSRLLGLTRAQTHDVVCEPDLPITMDDGTVQLADRWVARATRDTPQPTVLARSPYGRKQVFGLILGRLPAERGLQVLVQSARGTFGSEGRFSPFDEQADGAATLRWIRRQPWHADRIGLLGPSYLGLTQWAAIAAPDAGDDVAALAIQVSASQFHGQTFPGGSIALQTASAWMALIQEQERPLAPIAIARAITRLHRRLSELPLRDIDTRSTGDKVEWFQEAIATRLPDDAFWGPRDYSANVENVSAPAQFVGGWHDIFLPWMIEDFATLQAAGRRPQLIIGPWTHTAPELIATATGAAIGWLRAHMLGDHRLVRDTAVRLFVGGDPRGGGWRDLPGWPPPGTGERRLWLGGDGRLQETEPVQAADGGDRLRYDPEHPTPALGGAVIFTLRPVKDNRPLEARADVLTYTSAPLRAAVEAIGHARVALWVRASSPYFDIFARVCDVDGDGASWNVCDALTRISPGCADQTADGDWHVAFDLWPIGHRFAAGHRIRLQVSGGAHPRFARNLGTAEDPVAATRMQAVDIEILRGAQHPSVLVLPRTAGADGSA